MNVDINKITKTYDHNNKLIKMIDENLTYLGNVSESHFYYYFFFTIVSETNTTGFYSSKSTVNHKIKLNFNGWILLVLILFSWSLLFI